MPKNRRHNKSLHYDKVKEDSHHNETIIEMHGREEDMQSIITTPTPEYNSITPESIESLKTEEHKANHPLSTIMDTTTMEHSSIGHNNNAGHDVNNTTASIGHTSIEHHTHHHNMHMEHPVGRDTPQYNTVESQDQAFKKPYIYPHHINHDTSIVCMHNDSVFSLDSPNSAAYVSGMDRARRKLVAASLICCVFMVIELIAGMISNSLALMTDASHLLSDLCAFLISLFSLWVSNLKGNPAMSFGYHRAEILGALLSVLLIWGVTAALVYAAVGRFADPPPVHGGMMFITACLGTLANVFMTHILKMHSHGIGHVHTHDEDPSGVHTHDDGHTAHHACDSRMGSHHHHNGLSHAHHSADLGAPLLSKEYYQNHDTEAQVEEIENMNLRAAYIHAVGDLLQNVGVMIASALIWWNPTWCIADPICTLIFSVFVLLTTVSIIKEALNVLMEGTPLGVDICTLQEDLVSVSGVVEVHDLHVWSLSVGKPALACHLVVADDVAARAVLRAATAVCQRKHNILHTTIQTDFSSDKPCCDTEAHQKCLQPMKCPK